MDMTFITMHDLSPDAQVLYVSDSISGVLGYQPQDVVGKSCFEYFHPDETPFAKKVHDRGVHLDRAAVLSYCSLKRTDGVYVRCECVFTVVYSVIVACTSLYHFTEKSHSRAIAAPAIRRAFSASPNDPRYHMLTHLSTKFTTAQHPPWQHHQHHQHQHHHHEPRAALILNRFTRTLSILYATHALSEILGIPAEEAIGRSFYECIAEDCLQDAVDALERAKENDSIAYLCFRWRDPRTAVRNGGAGGSPRPPPPSAYEDGDDEDEGSSSSDDDIQAQQQPPRRAGSTPQSSVSSSLGNEDLVTEVEAVVSCTSDGLVVIVRKSRSRDPARGIFASPWAHVPLAPADANQQQRLMESIRQVAVFAWSLRSINHDIMSHALPGRPAPDSSEKVGDFATHRKRAREWKEMEEERERKRKGGEGSTVSE